MPITVEKIIRQHAKEKNIKFTPEEEKEMDRVEASTTPVNKKAKLWGILKLSGAFALLTSIWFYFKGRHSGFLAQSAPVAAPITP